MNSKQHQSLQALLANHRRRLQKLKLQQSISGLNTLPEILIEIEDIEGEIQRIEAQLGDKEIIEEQPSAPDNYPLIVALLSGGALFSIVIEFLQLVTGLVAKITFRTTDINDVIFDIVHKLCARQER